MAHGGLICRDCFVETGINSIKSHSQSEDETEPEFVCPNCGNDSFGI